MTSIAEAQPQTYFRPVIFQPSGRGDYVASACMSFEDWLRLDYEGGLSEWVDGEARLYMSATWRHQAIVEFLHIFLSMFVRRGHLGVIKLAPYAMEAAQGGSGREPDLMFIAAEHLARRGESHLSGPPDLAIEVVSEDSVARDFVEKLREYEAAGIPEYWVIDSRPGHERAAFFVHDGERLAPVPADGDGVYRSTAIPGLWLRVAWLFDEAADPDAALAEVEADAAR
ncbi:MAG: Uma2 family endonuclease [Dehalococcoidia bacterium]